MGRKPRQEEIKFKQPNNDYQKRVIERAAQWASYYRSNIHRFAMDYLHVKLKIFQMIVLVMMNMSTTMVLIACRGIGKSYLAAIFCVCRCILYPGRIVPACTVMCMTKLT